MGNKHSQETTTPKPQLLNHSTTLQSDTYSLIFNVGAGAGVMMIIMLVCLIIARVLFPKLFTGLCNKTKSKNRAKEAMEDLYGRLKNRYRRVNDPPPPQHPAPTPQFFPMNFMPPQMMAPQPVHMPMPIMPYQAPIVYPQRQDIAPRFVELPADPQGAAPALPPRQAGNA